VDRINKYLALQDNNVVKFFMSFSLFNGFKK
jgi:hypothetical protein